MFKIIVDTLPFDPPYRKIPAVYKDRFGNVVKNPAKHLAKMQARELAEKILKEGK
jgi:hypothetical protein